MPTIEIYSTNICPYCVRAKALIQRKGFTYKELNIEQDRSLMRDMLTRSQRRTVPQIFIDNVHVGGYDDLAALDSAGKLDSLLGIEPRDDSTIT